MDLIVLELYGGGSAHGVSDDEGGIFGKSALGNSDYRHAVAVADHTLVDDSVLCKLGSLCESAVLLEKLDKGVGAESHASLNGEFLICDCCVCLNESGVGVPGRKNLLDLCACLRRKNGEAISIYRGDYHLLDLALESLSRISHALGGIGLIGLVDSESEGLLLGHLHSLNGIFKLNRLAVSAHAGCGIVVVEGRCIEGIDLYGLCIAELNIVVCTCGREKTSSDDLIYLRRILFR